MPRSKRNKNPRCKKPVYWCQLKYIGELLYLKKSYLYYNRSSLQLDSPLYLADRTQREQLRLLYYKEIAKESGGHELAHNQATRKTWTPLTDQHLLFNSQMRMLQNNIQLPVYQIDFFEGQTNYLEHPRIQVKSGTCPAQNIKVGDIAYRNLDQSEIESSS